MPAESSPSYFNRAYWPSADNGTGNDRAPGETVLAPFLVADRDALTLEAIGAVVPVDDLEVRHEGLS